MQMATACRSRKIIYCVDDAHRRSRSFIRRRAHRRQKFKTSIREALPKPPTEFFEPSALPEIPPNFKPEYYYLLHNIKLLELPTDWLASSDIEVLNFDANQTIVGPGDDDDCMYAVLEGSIAVYISPPAAHGKQYMVKHIGKGNSFYSLLSLIDILMKIPSKFKTITLKTLTPSKVARYNIGKFHDAYINSPEAWSRPIIIILTRLLHVTLTTLHQYLGLGEELFKRRTEDKPFDDHERHSSGYSMRLLSPKSKAQPRPSTSVDNRNELMSTAVRWFGETLHLNSADAQTLLQPKIQIKTVDEGHVLVEQGSDEDSSLIIVLNGALKIQQDPVLDDDEEDLCEPWSMLVFQKELVGALQILTSEPAFYSIRAHKASAIACIGKQDFQEIMGQRPAAILPAAYSVLRRLSSFVRAVDFAFDWEFLDSGQAAYRQGDVAEAMYIVLSGRLRSVIKKTAIEEFGRGDVLGLAEVLQKKPRSSTVLAVRFSQLARVSEGLLSFVKIQFPQVGFRLVRLLGQYYNRESEPTASGYPHEKAPADPMARIKNLHTVAIFPTSFDVPLISFTCELYNALNASTRVLRLSSKTVSEHLGKAVLDKEADLQLMHWLNAQEDAYPLIIYECDYTATNWTRRCLCQADAILVVANGESKPPKKHFIEEYLEINREGLRTRKELILLWREGVKHPKGTFEWLKGSWFSGHYHVRAPDRMYLWPIKVNLDEKEVIDYYDENVFWEKVDFTSDFARLSRILTGNAVGLVLGGGGARGAAHVGVIDAMRDHGIPVDIVGGTSIGSMVGGLYAEDPHQDLEARAKSWFTVMCSLWRKIWDLTYAHSAMFTGAGFNRTLQDLFGDKQIEDLWLPYFCISTDISTSEMRVHRDGPLWAYCRASMSLAGYLPPLCDPVDGHLLLDGGYVNILPADVMRSTGARYVIAVDVGSATETDLYNYGDSLSGTWVLLKKLNPFARPVRILGMDEIQSRLAFVSCVRQLEMVKKATYCHYLRPPLEPFKTLDFAKFDFIRDLGYKYGEETFPEMIKTDTNIKAVMNPDKLRRLAHGRRVENPRSPDTSFTDLAAQISGIPSAKRHHNSPTDRSVFDESDWYIDDASTDVDTTQEGSSEPEDEDHDSRISSPRN
ncbi:cyclic nucleotide-binding domain protein [Aphelenchoides avenae]|nr:cyclic nucleotide-binding domain protein [Aphelenchus avenae]